MSTLADESFDPPPPPPHTPPPPPQSFLSDLTDMVPPHSFHRPPLASPPYQPCLDLREWLGNVARDFLTPVFSLLRHLGKTAPSPSSGFPRTRLIRSANHVCRFFLLFVEPRHFATKKRKGFYDSIWICFSSFPGCPLFYKDFPVIPFPPPPPKPYVVSYSLKKAAPSPEALPLLTSLVWRRQLRLAFLTRRFFFLYDQSPPPWQLMGFPVKPAPSSFSPETPLSPRFCI